MHGWQMNARQAMVLRHVFGILSMRTALDRDRQKLRRLFRQKIMSAIRRILSAARFPYNGMILLRSYQTHRLWLTARREVSFRVVIMFMMRRAIREFQVWEDSLHYLLQCLGRTLIWLILIFGR